MPGQNKRTGRWVVHSETQDYAEWRDYLRRLRFGRVDLKLTRLDADPAQRWLRETIVACV